MDIKDLNKTQLILLAVLLSFITSIATGITTVTLMQQAPASFTTPVNNVIRQTIEKIQQVEGKTITQTVIVKEEDLVVDAIAKNKSSLFTVTREVQDAELKIVEVGAGRGFAVSTDTVATDAVLVPEKGVYYLKNDSGKFKAEFVFADKAGFSFLKIGAPVNGKDKLVTATPAFGDVDKMKTGQKILVLGSSVSSFIFDGNKDLNINVTKSNGGGVVLDLDGNVLGMALFRDDVSFVPIKAINDSLKSFVGSIGASSPTLPLPVASPVLAPQGGQGGAVQP